MPFTSGHYMFPINKVDFDLPSSLLTGSLNKCVPSFSEVGSLFFASRWCKNHIVEMVPEKQKDVSSWELRYTWTLLMERLL